MKEKDIFYLVMIGFDWEKNNKIGVGDGFMPFYKDEKRAKKDYPGAKIIPLKKTKKYEKNT